MPFFAVFCRGWHFGVLMCNYAALIALWLWRPFMAVVLVLLTLVIICLFCLRLLLFACFACFVYGCPLVSYWFADDADSNRQQSKKKGYNSNTLDTVTLNHLINKPHANILQRF